MSNFPQTQGQIPSQDVQIFFRRFTPKENKGHPIVLVHGLSYFSYDWIEVATALSENRDIVAIDMRGFGNSTWSPTQDYRIATNARDFVSILDFFGWQKAILLGHSMGARHCTYCASTEPSRIAGLISVDFAPTVNAEGSARVAKRMGSLPDRFSSFDGCIKFFEQQAGSTFNDSQRRRWKEFTEISSDGSVVIRRDPYFRDSFRQILETGKRPPAEFDMWDVLKKVQCHSLFVRGKRSDMFSADSVPQVLSCNANASVVELDTGHDVGGQDPNGLVLSVNKFLDQRSL